MTDTTTRPAAELPIWQARSFWAQIAALLSAVATVAGWADLAEDAAQLPDAIMPVITAGLGLWAYVERLMGRAKLVWRW